MWRPRRMKVGDLVQVKDICPKHGKVMLALVIELGVYVGNCDVKVLWQTHTEPLIADSKLLKIVGS
jgi:hypothetical protein